MPKASFVDFKALKAALTMEQVLAHYDLLDQFKRSGENLSGPCPLHAGSNPTQFRVSLSKNVWNCFGKCQQGGNVLDFIVRKENVTLHAAALQAIGWFQLDPETMSSPPDKSDTDEPARPEKTSALKPASLKTTGPEKATPNAPLKFRLDKLDQTHPYLTQRKLKAETIQDFGLGYCAKGMMAERIAIPIRNAEGAVVAYAGRFPGEPDEDTPKYKLPQGFRKSLELFNLHRALQEPVAKVLGVVPGFFDCMQLHQQGCRKVVALMSYTLSQAQEELLRQHAERFPQVLLLFPENEAGRAARDDLSLRLARFTFVKVHLFDEEGNGPEQLNVGQVGALFA